MALSLGDINFRLGADARSLGKSLKQLKDFGRQVDQVSGQTTKAGQAIERAFRNQEKASGDALRTIINMNAKLRNYDFGAPLIRQTNKAWREYNATLTQGQISAVEFQRAQTRFRNSLAATNREFARLKQATNTAVTPTNKLQSVFKDLAATSILINGPLGGVAARLTVLASVAKSSGFIIAGFVAGIAGGVTALYKLGTAVVRVGQEFQTYKQTLLAISGNQIVANARFEEALKIAQDTGQVIGAVVPAYAKFQAAAKGTNLEGKVSTDIFKSVSLVMSRLQAPAETTQGVFKALEQIMSKGTVQAEELRNQLGDRLPGAFQIAARAMGVTTSELGAMLKAGAVLSDDFLPKFADELRKTFGLQNTESINNYRTSINRLSNEYTLLLERLDSILNITNRVKGGFDSVTNAIRFMKNNLETIIALFGAAGGAALAMVAPKILAGFVALTKLIRTATAAVLALNVAMLANPAGALATAFARLALIVGGAVGGFFAFRNAMKKTAETTVISLDSVQQYIEGQEILRNSTKQSTDTIIEQVNKQIEALKLQKKALESQIPEPTISAPDTSMMDTVMNKLRYVFRDIPAIRDLLTPDPNGEVHAQLKKVKDDLTAYQEQLLKLKNIQNEVATAGGSSGNEQSKAYMKANDSIQELITSVRDLQAISGAQKLGINSVLHEERLARARKILKDLTQNELTDLDAKLNKIGIVGSDLANKLANLYGEQENLTKSIQEFKDQVAKAPEALREYSDALNEIKGRMDAMKEGPAALEEFEKNLSRTKTLRTYEKRLFEAGLTVSDVSKRIRDMRKAMEEFDIIASKSEKFERMKKGFQDVATNGIDKFADSLVNSIRTGENVFKGFGSVVEGVLSDLLREMIEFTIAAPLKSFMKDMFSGWGMGGTGGGGWMGSIANFIGSFFMSRNGSVFNNGTMTRMASGGLLTRPTIMPSMSGPILGGEAGTEAIMPLARDSSGALGVKASVSGSTTGAIETVTVNVYGGEGEAKTEQTRAGNNLTIDVMFRQIENRISSQIAQGGTKLNKAIEGRYALNSARGNQQ